MSVVHVLEEKGERGRAPLEFDLMERYRRFYESAEGGQAPTVCGRYAPYEIVKRALDIVLAVVGLIVLFPLFLIVALAIYLEDRNPVLYKHYRVGHRGRLFMFYKFRSMVHEADELKKTLLDQNEVDGPIFKMRNDPRVTRVGRFIRRTSLDELPQLVNVLLGQLTIVGPRPHLPHEVAEYSSNEWVRLSVKPGLMCFREVTGRSTMQYHEWIQSDIEYIRNRSLRLDAKIFVKGVWAIVRGVGAF
ncbi:MAG: sugar transferase [Fimbriimonadaceae bacterium]